MDTILSLKLEEFAASLPRDPALHRRTYIEFFKQFLQTEKEQIFLRHLAGAKGIDVLHSHTELIDSLIKAVYQLVMAEQKLISPDPIPLAILAAGGYGRRELQPHSDIDILFLFPNELTEEMGEICTGILHYLWDIGFELGHSLRSIEDCLKYAREDLTSQTSMMESRYVTGDLVTFAQLESSLTNSVLRNMMSSYVRGKLRELEDRHHEYDNSIYHLEPNVKNGVGGLRDMHTALWIAQARFGVRTLRGLQQLGVLSETELIDTEKNMDFLWRVRNDLHYRAGRKQDTLNLQYQEIVATDLDFHDDLLGSAVENFMRQYYISAEHVKEYSIIYIDRCFPPRSRKSGHNENQITIAPGLFQRDGAIHLLDVSPVSVEPPMIMRCFLETQRRNLPLAVGTKTLIRNRLSRLHQDDFLKSDAKHAFLDMLVETGNLGRALREMHELKVLEKFIPEFDGLTCLVRQDLQHRYTVDEHTFHLVDYLQELKNQTTLDARKNTPPPKELMEVFHEAKSDQVLMLAALLHDIGKVSKENHVKAGLKMIPAILDRLGSTAEEREKILFLVEEHLLMSEVTQHHDLDDKRVLSNFAWEVNTVDKLKLLYCLTYADMKAVGPEIWTPWKATLLSELYHKTRALLTGAKITDADDHDEINAVKESLLNRFKGEVEPDEVDVHFAGMSSRYILGTAPAVIVKHIQFIRELLKQRQYQAETRKSLKSQYPLVTDISHYRNAAYSDFIVCTLDMPGLFSNIAGTLTSKGMSILSAQIFTRNDGIVIDTLQIDHRSPGWTDEELVWTDLNEELQRVLSGEKDISAILTARKKTSTAIRRPSTIPTEISISNMISDTQTVIDIRTQDRLGLLFTLTHTLSQLGLSIGTSRIATYGQRAVDVFYVTDLQGKKITESPRLTEIQAALESALKNET